MVSPIWLLDDSNPLQCSCLENPMDMGAWWAEVHGIARSRTQLSNFTFTFPFHALEKEMAIHSNVLAWRIPGTGEPGGLPSMGSHRVGHDWIDLATAAAAGPIWLLDQTMRIGDQFYKLITYRTFSHQQIWNSWSTISTGIYSINHKYTVIICWWLNFLLELQHMKNFRCQV